MNPAECVGCARTEASGHNIKPHKHCWRTLSVGPRFFLALLPFSSAWAECGSVCLNGREVNQGIKSIKVIYRQFFITVDDYSVLKPPPQFKLSLSALLGWNIRSAAAIDVMVVCNGISPKSYVVIRSAYEYAFCRNKCFIILNIRITILIYSI